MRQPEIARAAAGLAALVREERSARDITLVQQQGEGFLAKKEVILKSEPVWPIGIFRTITIMVAEVATGFRDAGAVVSGGPGFGLTQGTGIGKADGMDIHTMSENFGDRD